MAVTAPAPQSLTGTPWHLPVFDICPRWALPVLEFFIYAVWHLLASFVPRELGVLDLGVHEQE